MALPILLTLFYLFLFNYLIYRFRVFQIKPFKPVVTNLLFNLKFLTGIFIWIVYTFYYKDIQNNDVHKFYNDAVILNKAAYQNPHAFVSLMVGKAPDTTTVNITSQMKNWERNFDEAPFNENRTIIKLNALIMFFSFRTYFVHILFMCFISLVGWVLLLNAVFRNSKPHQILLAMLTMLLPSVLFWTSGVMKEPLLVLGLGIFMHGLLNRVTFKNALCIASGFVIILISKFFILAALIPASIAFVLFRSSNKNSGVQQISFLQGSGSPVSGVRGCAQAAKRKICCISKNNMIIAKYAGIMALLLFIAFNIQYVIPRINPEQMLVNKQQHSVKEAEYFNAGSRIAIPPITANAASIIQTAPIRIWNTLFRPYPWEGKNIMMLASALENLLVLLLIAYYLLNTDYRNFKQLNTVLMLLSFSVAYFALIGICTPVLGNLVRYRAPVLPFFLFGLMLNVKENGVHKKLMEIPLIWFSVVILTACSSGQNGKPITDTHPRSIAKDSFHSKIIADTPQQNAHIDSPGYIDEYPPLRQELNKKNFTKNGNYYMLIPFSDNAVKIAWGNDTIKRVYNEPLNFRFAENIRVEWGNQRYLILKYGVGSDAWENVVLPLNNSQPVKIFDNGLCFDTNNDFLVREGHTTDTILQIENLRTQRQQFIIEKEKPCSSAINHYCIDSMSIHDKMLYYKWVTPNIIDSIHQSIERRIQITI